MGGPSEGARSWAGPLALCGAVLFWGFVPTATRYLAETFTPGNILLARFSFGGVVVVLLFLIWRPPMPSRANMPKAVALGLYAALSFNVPVAYGINIIEGGTAALLIGTQPIFIAVLAGIFLKEHIPRRMIAGLLLALAGSAVIALTAGGGFSLEGRYLLGCGLVLMAAFLWSSYSVVAKPHLGPDLPAPSVAMIGTLFGLPVVLFLGVDGYLDRLSGLPPVGWFAVLLLAAGASVAAPVLWNVGLSLGQASRAGLYLNLVPIFGVVSSIALLGESPGVEVAVGGAMILFGILLATIPPAWLSRRARASTGARM
jgi:drug/metabolite transporter (DMT)-like permease